MANRFVGFLKKAGQLTIAAAPIAEQFMPILTPFLNLALPQKSQAIAATGAKIESEVSLMSQSVMTAETIGNILISKGVGITGPQKAAAAGAGIMAILLNSEAMAGKQIADPVAAQTASANIAGGIADWWNAVNGSVLPNVPVAPLNPPVPVSPPKPTI